MAVPGRMGPLNILPFHFFYRNEYISLPHMPQHQQALPSGYA